MRHLPSPRCSKGPLYCSPIWHWRMPRICPVGPSSQVTLCATAFCTLLHSTLCRPPHECHDADPPHQEGKKGVSTSNPKSGQLSAKLAAERRASSTQQQGNERMMVGFWAHGVRKAHGVGDQTSVVLHRRTCADVAGCWAVELKFIGHLFLIVFRSFFLWVL